MKAELRNQIFERGYVLVPNVIPKEQLDAVISDIFEHTNADPNDPGSWYRPSIISPDGMIEMYHYQSMWDNRQHPELHEIFASILGTEKLWVSIDRANLKPPAHFDYPQYSKTGFIHWDTDMDRYPDIPFAVQGVIALANTDETMGGFQCVPELYRELEDWIIHQRQSGVKIGRQPDISDYSITKVPMRAGDVVIWSTLLPHGNGQNVSNRPRLAQYISMHPAEEDDDAYRQARIESWQSCHPLHNEVFPGDPRRIEEARREPALLTPLGRKLLGLNSWS
ncbi:phytanoyl-CoA dioxygenase family protein [Alicyclobacillus fodiniaquatilis]|jgi:hypothetical protein|uniref:Phytanoyl-CoA dioxygenase family protein n=1 Tax=Alicyclobacillus fodiniaquatilis TaxID=1661150 RepID=A0ABW4JNM2_9BACL